MTSPARHDEGPVPPMPVADTVTSLDAVRIARAIERRTRYRYVRPRVLPEGRGWKIVSPNCSRTVDPDGGEIDVAWLTPAPDGGWMLFARNDDTGDWRCLHRDASLPALLALLCADPGREFWR